MAEIFTRNRLFPQPANPESVPAFKVKNVHSMDGGSRSMNRRLLLTSGISMIALSRMANALGDSQFFRGDQYRMVPSCRFGSL